MHPTALEGLGTDLGDRMKHLKARTERSVLELS